MKDKIKITANLSVIDVEEILKDYFSKEGYNVSSFRFKIGEVGYHPVSSQKGFTGVDCELKRKDYTSIR
jgi:hypothetical protein